MPTGENDVYYTGNVAIRTPGRTTPPSHLRIGRSEVFRLRAVTSAVVEPLDPALGDVFLFSCLNSTARLHAGGRTMTMDPDCVLVVSGSPCEVTATEAADVVFSVSTGDVIRDAGLDSVAGGPMIHEIATNRLFADPLNVALTHAFDRLESGHKGLDPREIDFLNLLWLGVVQSPADASPARHSSASLQDRARALIARLHTDPSTSPATVAEIMGVPLRTLQRAFAAQGSSVAREIRRARVHAAQALLRADSASESRALHTAREAGFGSVVTMRRALQEFAGDEAQRPTTDNTA